MAHGFEVHLASSGISLEWLQDRYPDLPCHNLPDYKVTYQQNGSFITKIALQIPRVLQTIRQERAELRKLHLKYNFDGVISDNRFGCYIKGVPSVFITHQIRVRTPIAQQLVRRVNYGYIRHFDRVWIPDVKNINLAGKLSKYKNGLPPMDYVGVLSAFDPVKKPSINPEYSFAALISGPEPQRTAIENEVYREFQGSNENCVIIRGTNTPSQNLETEHIRIFNRLSSARVQEIVNNSKVVVFRGGYSSIMDLSVHGKKVIIIPTPGQTEQEYLAKRMEKLGYGPRFKQGKFSMSEAVKKLVLFTGIPAVQENHPVNWKDLLAFFERE
jgi:UDP-N-acetylglucosamine transferase subunit ALG13